MVDWIERPYRLVLKPEGMKIVQSDRNLLEVL